MLQQSTSALLSLEVVKKYFLQIILRFSLICLQCGFFNRAKYEDKVPSYSAVRIRREERAVHSAKDNWGSLETKPWMTTWHDKEHYS